MMTLTLVNDMMIVHTDLLGYYNIVVGSAIDKTKCLI